jgi:amino acid permease
VVQVHERARIACENQEFFTRSESMRQCHFVTRQRQYIIIIIIVIIIIITMKRKRSLLPFDRL